MPQPPERIRSTASRDTEPPRAPYRCAVIDDYQDIARGLADWGSLAPSVEVDFHHHPLGGETAVAAALDGYDIVVAMRERTPFPASLIGRLGRLKLLVTTGMSNKAIDIEAAKAAGIVVCGTRGTGQATAELTWALILSAARRLPDEMRNMENGGWQTTLGMGLFGRTLGVVGLGTVGGQVASIGRAFGMQVVAWSRNLTEERCRQLGVDRAASLEELLSVSDVVTIHLVLGERTRGLIGEAEIAAMKPSALLVNTSRAAIVEQAALLAAVREGRIRGAAVDVYDREPPPPDHPLRRTAGILATPHLGYVTDDNLRSHYREAVEDIAAWLGGAPVRLISS